MPWYDYQCRNCEHEFTEVLRMDDRKKPTRRKCPECGRKMVKILLGTLAIADSVNIGRTKPDNAYSEVVSKINETNKIKGTRYELQDRLENREKYVQKPLTKYEIKKRVNDAL